MKVILINPKGFQKGFNAGLGYISAVLKKEGHEVLVMDLNNKPRDLTLPVEQNKFRNSNMVGISVKSQLVNSAKKASSLIKLMRKGSILIAGGPHISIDPLGAMRDLSDVKVGIIGEGELTMTELCKGKDLSEIKGIIYRNGNELIENPRRKWINNLDSLPFPEYSCFDSLSNNNINTYPLITSRGCPYECIYCAVRLISGRKWRFRSPKNVIEELLHAKFMYKIKHFEVLDDVFGLNPKIAKEFCELLISERIRLPWSCPNGIRADHVDEELIELMKRSGCKKVQVGIESLVEDVFQKIGKGEKLDDVITAVNTIKKYGIRVGGFFIIGLPGSTFTLDLKSIEMAKDLGLDDALFGLLVPYRGTAIYSSLKSDDSVRWLSNWDLGFHFSPKTRVVFDTPAYPAEKRIQAFFMGNIEFNNFSAFGGKKVSRIIDTVIPVVKYRPRKLFRLIKYLAGVLYVKMRRFT